MKKVVRSISLRRKPNKVLIIGYSSSDRGTRIVASSKEISTEGKTKSEEKAEIAAAIATMLEPQLSSG